MYKFLPYVKYVISQEKGKGDKMTDITSALTTALASVGTDALGAIASVLPAALAIAGAVMVVTIGVRVFKKNVLPI